MSDKSYRSSLFKRIIDLGVVRQADVDDLVRIWRVGSGDEKAITLANFVATVDADLGTGGSTLTELIEELELNKVPYTGATGDVDLGEFGLSGGYFKFDTTPTSTPTDQGTMYWDEDDNTIDVILNGYIMKVGEDQFYPVKNQTGSNIPKGTSVRFNGTVGSSGRLLIAPFLADGSLPSTRFMGVTAEDIDNGEDGKVLWFGRLRGIDTSAFAEGDILYASTTVAGGFQTAVPTAPNNIVEIAAVVTDAMNGTIFIRPQFISGSSVGAGAGLSIDGSGDIQLGKLRGTGTQYVDSKEFFPTGFNEFAISSNFDNYWDGNFPYTYIGHSEFGSNLSAGLSVDTSSALRAGVFASANSLNTSIRIESSQPSGGFILLANSLGAKITDTFLSKGLEYASDYESNFTARSLVTKQYVDNAVSGGLTLTSPITGYTVGANTALAATDTLLGAFGKIQGQINARVSGSGTLNFVPKFSASGTIGDSTIFEQNGGVGIGTTSIGNFSLRISRSIGGSATVISASNTGQIQSGVSVARIWATGVSVANSVTVARIDHFQAAQATLGTGSAITTQVGFLVDSSLNNASVNYGFQGGIAAGSDRWNLFMSGTANNYLAGNLWIGTTSGTNTLDVNGTTRIRTISNLGSTATRFLVASATGVVSERTGAQLLTDAGGIAGTIASGQVAFGTGVNTISGDSRMIWSSVNGRLGIRVGTALDVLHVGGIIRYGSGTDVASQGQLSFGTNLITLGGADSGSNTSIALLPRGTGFVGINTTSPTNTLDVNGTARIRTISNLGLTATRFLVASATGVISERTGAELAADIGAVTITGTQTITGAKTFNNALLIQSGSNPILRIATTDNNSTINFRNVFNEDAATIQMSTPSTELALSTNVSNYNIRIQPHGTGRIKLPNVPIGTGDVLGRDSSNNLVRITGLSTKWIQTTTISGASTTQLLVPDSGSLTFTPSETTTGKKYKIVIHHYVDDPPAGNVNFDVKIGGNSFSSITSITNGNGGSNLFEFILEFNATASEAYMWLNGINDSTAIGGLLIATYNPSINQSIEVIAITATLAQGIIYSKCEILN